MAQILGKPIYAITNVAIIPLSSREDAARAIIQAQGAARRDGAKDGEDEFEESEAEDSSGSDADSADEGIITSPAVNFDNQESPAMSRVAQDVFGNKGRNGRFGLNWLSRKRWGITGGSPLPKSDHESSEKEAKRDDGPTKDQPLAPEPEIQTEAEATNVVQEAANDTEAQAQRHDIPSKALELMPKLLRYTKLIFASNNFFFSYDYDLTRRYSSRDPRAAQLPLHVLADQLVWQGFPPLIPSRANSVSTRSTFGINT